MKIGIFIEDISLLGGVEKVTLNLANLFIEQGHNVYLFTIQNKYNLTLKNIKHISIDRYSLSKIEDEYQIDYYIIEIIHLGITNKIIKKLSFTNKPIFSILHNTPYMYLKYYISHRDILQYPKFIIYFSGIGFIRKINNKVLINKILNKTHVITISQGAYSELRYLFPKKKEKIHFILNPVDIKHFNNSCIDTKRENKIVFLGRLDFQKDLFLLLDVWKQFCKYRQDYTLHLVGDGRLKQKLVKIVQKQGIKNLFFEPRTDNVAEVYNKAKIVILTSKYEGYPTVFTEALTYSCYLFSCKSDGGTKELITQENGCYVNSRNYKIIAKELNMFVTKIDKQYFMYDNSELKNRNNEVYNSWFFLLNKGITN